MLNHHMPGKIAHTITAIVPATKTGNQYVHPYSERKNCGGWFELFMARISLAGGRM
jgi:hypothetical protein